jgi:Ca2+-transporting ATPase
MVHKTAEELLSELKTDRENGLTPAQAEEKLAEHGRNELKGKEKESLAKRFLGQMKDPMIIVLLIAAVLFSSPPRGGLDRGRHHSGHRIVNACISHLPEDNAEKALEALQKMSAPLAKVTRGGQLLRLETAELVPGDLITLEAGDLVPADDPHLECQSLKADESAMTGESVPVNSRPFPPSRRTPPWATGTKGHLLHRHHQRPGPGRVTSTAWTPRWATSRALLMGEEDSTTPLQRKMGEISKTLSFICLVVCAVMFGAGLYSTGHPGDVYDRRVPGGGRHPEGLPAIVTIVLAWACSGWSSATPS